jgi:hypothetical protein
MKVAPVNTPIQLAGLDKGKYNHYFQFFQYPDSINKNFLQQIDTGLNLQHQREGISLNLFSMAVSALNILHFIRSRSAF